MCLRSKCVVCSNTTKFSLFPSLNPSILCVMKPQYAHLGQSSNFAFVKTYFYLQKDWSSHFLYLNFSWAVQDSVSRGKLYFPHAPKRKYKIDLKWIIMLPIFSYSDMCHRCYWLLSHCFPSEGFFGEPLFNGVLEYPFVIGLYVIFCSHQQVSFLVLLPVISWIELCLEKTFCKAAMLSTWWQKYHLPGFPETAKLFCIWIAFHPEEYSLVL